MFILMPIVLETETRPSYNCSWKV